MIRAKRGTFCVHWEALSIYVHVYRWTKNITDIFRNVTDSSWNVTKYSSKLKRSKMLNYLKSVVFGGSEVNRWSKVDVMCKRCEMLVI